MFWGIVISLFILTRAIYWGIRDILVQTSGRALPLTSIDSYRIVPTLIREYSSPAVCHHFFTFAVALYQLCGKGKDKRLALGKRDGDGECFQSQLEVSKSRVVVVGSAISTSTEPGNQRIVFWAPR